MDFEEMPRIVAMQTTTPLRVKARKVDNGFSVNDNQAT